MKQKQADKFEEEMKGLKEQVRTSPHLATSRHISPHLDTSRHISTHSPCLPWPSLTRISSSHQAASLEEDAELPLALKAGGALAGFAVNVKSLGFRYTPELPFLFRGAELSVDSKSRIVLLGENGNGKTYAASNVPARVFTRAPRPPARDQISPTATLSAPCDVPPHRTLVKLLLGDLSASEGEVVIAGGARISLVNQHHADQIDLTLSPLQFMVCAQRLQPSASRVPHRNSRRRLASSTTC